MKGMILALASDFVVVGSAKTFKMGLSELDVGVPFPGLILKVNRGVCLGV